MINRCSQWLIIGFKFWFVDAFFCAAAAMAISTDFVMAFFLISHHQFGYEMARRILKNN